MKTRRNAAHILEEGVANAGAPPHDEQVPPLEDNANVDQAQDNPPHMIKAEMRAILDQTDLAMTTQEQATTFKPQAMTDQDNRNVAPHPHQQVTTMASCLRSCTRMNPPTFYGSKVDK